MADAEVKVEGGDTATKVEDDTKKEQVKGDNANVKVEDFTELEQQIIRQIEYYFGDHNLQRDKFMQEKTGENEGWVDISVLLTFNRLKKITEDAAAIADAIAKSPNGLVELSEDKLRLRRHPEHPLPEFNETRRKELAARTAYAKGFPLDSELDVIISYVHSNFKNAEHIVMRKYFDFATKGHKFKGSIFITFKTKEEAEEFVKKPDVKYGETPLLRYLQPKYVELKKIEREENAKKKKEIARAKEEAAETPLPKGAVVHFVGVEGSEISREDIKSRISEVEPSVGVAFISFQKGDKEGNLRFNKENDGKTLLEKLDEGKVSLHWKVF